MLFLTAFVFTSCSQYDRDVSVSEEAWIRMPDENSSPYVTKVFDYIAAPGQFTNCLPTCKKGEPKDSVIARCEKVLVGPENGGLITLGGFGGYIIVGFDHTIQNVAGKRDFRVKGNTFWNNSSNKDADSMSGSSEPGIIEVSSDINMNGEPDDTWYEIAGSEYKKSESVKNYEITFCKPETRPDGAEVKDIKWKEYIKWIDNQKNTGYRPKNGCKKQPCFPLWVERDTVTFKGHLLPKNGKKESADNWVLSSFAYGYADNAPNDNDVSAIDIDWAVKEDGTKANLHGVDFIRVYNGENQECGWLGETSTEISGFVDLHLTEENIETVEAIDTEK